MNTLVIGGSGGIGAGLVEVINESRQFGRVVATHHQSPGRQYAGVSWLELDLASQQSVTSAADTLLSSLSAIDLFICAAGYLHGDKGSPEKSLKAARPELLMHSYLVNACGPLLMFQQCMPLIKSAKKPIVIFLSAQVGSIEDNHSGGWYSYRMSKAALNMGIRNLGLECARFKNQPIVVAVHPGTTTTKLSEPFVKHRKAIPMLASESAKAILALVKNLKPADTGKFLKTDGQQVPW